MVIDILSEMQIDNKAGRVYNMMIKKLLKKGHQIKYMKKSGNYNHEYKNCKMDMLMVKLLLRQ